MIDTTVYADSIVTDEACRTTRFARADLHASLRRLVPADHIILGKRFVRVDVGPELATLHFTDGTTALAHIVVGADGIRSAVRTQYLPEYGLAFTNSIAYRANFPASLLPPDVAAGLTNEATHWLSDAGASLFTSPLSASYSFRPRLTGRSRPLHLRRLRHACQDLRAGDAGDALGQGGADGPPARALQRE